MQADKAKELCIKAHEGQWRRGWRYTTDSEEAEIISLMMIVDYASGLPDQIPLTTGFIAVWENDMWRVKQPYSAHPMAVAEMMSTDEEKTVAYLHDVVEDCEGWELVTRVDYKSYYYLVDPQGNFTEITQRIYFALVSLTKSSGEDYDKYLERLSSSHLAVKVKIADMFHNMSSNPTEKQKIKYKKGLTKLLTFIGEVE